jgi:hypothetical protein
VAPELGGQGALAEAGGDPGLDQQAAELVESPMAGQRTAFEAVVAVDLDSQILDRIEQRRDAESHFLRPITEPLELASIAVQVASPLHEPLGGIAAFGIVTNHGTPRF